MKTYIYRGTYTASAWKALIAKPADIGAIMRASIERFSGRVIACFVVFGSDPIGFIEFPDDTAANAWAVSLAAQDGVGSVELNPVVSTKDLQKSLQVAKKLSGDSGGSY